LSSMAAFELTSSGMRHDPVDAKRQKRHRMPLNLNEAFLETFPELACLAVASHPLHLSSLLLI